jgi:hypothetical protein
MIGRLYLCLFTGFRWSNRWSANSAEGASADPLNFRVADFYSVSCRFESCWDRQFIFPLQSFQEVARVFGSPGQKVSQFLFQL